MESARNTFGKGFTPEDKKAVSAGIEKFKSEGLEHAEGEIEKSPEVLLVVEKISEYLNEEFQLLGIKTPASISADRIHIVDEEWLKKRFPGVGANGIYDPLTDSIFIKNSDQRLQSYKSMFHEAVHYASFKSYHADWKARVINPRRCGYTAYNPREAGHEHFRGLNEAVVDKTVRMILRKHQAELIRELRIGENEGRQRVSYCNEYMDVLDVIVDKIAGKKKEDRDAVWRRFQKGEFTGEMMHLRDVEEVFGKGSLRVLAALDSGIKSSVPEETAEQNILKYFQTDDVKLRDKIAKEILMERERLQYEKIRG